MVPLTSPLELGPKDKSPSALRALRFNLLLAFFIWIVWLLFGGRNALHHLLIDWLSGGAVAFPIFTKLLHIAPFDARNFSLAIQSVGMGAASLSILYLRVPIERRALLYAGLPGIAGAIFGARSVAPFIPPVIIRTSFTVLVASLGIALLLVNREGGASRNLKLP